MGSRNIVRPHQPVPEDHAEIELPSDGISLEMVTSSMTINEPAAMILAMFLVVPERQGAEWNKTRDTIQNNIFERVHCAEGMDLSATTTIKDSACCRLGQIWIKVEPRVLFCAVFKPW